MAFRALVSPGRPRTTKMPTMEASRPTDTTASGKINGAFQSSGIRSAYTQRLEMAGYKTESKVIKTAAR